MTDKFDEPNVINRLKFNKTGGKSKNGKKIADEIAKHSKSLARDVDQPGKAASEIFTLVVGTPTVGYWTAEIEMRLLWPKRQVPGVARIDKQMLATFNVTYANNGKNEIGPRLLDQMLVEVSSGKPIDNEHKDVGENLAEQFIEYWEEAWPATERETKYRKPTDSNAIEIDFQSASPKMLTVPLTDALSKTLLEVDSKNKSEKEKIVFVIGDEDFGWFKIYIDIEARMETDELKVVELSASVWFKNTVVKDMPRLKLIGVNPVTNKLNRKDVQEATDKIFDEYKKQLKDQKKSEEAAKAYFASIMHRGIRGYGIRNF